MPYSDPELSANNPPKAIFAFRQSIEKADSVIICTPEYIFNLQGSLKNAVEWCVSDTLFFQKLEGLMTASASAADDKAHEELLLIVKTLKARFSVETTLLITGMKGKFDQHANLIDEETILKLNSFITAFQKRVNLI